MTPTIAKEMTKAITLIKNAAKTAGISTLYVLVTDKLVKFESMWGFKVINVYLGPQGTLVLMSQETN